MWGFLLLFQPTPEDPLVIDVKLPRLPALRISK